jgi:hypothetical protein
MRYLREFSINYVEIHESNLLDFYSPQYPFYLFLQVQTWDAKVMWNRKKQNKENKLMDCRK